MKRVFSSLFALVFAANAALAQVVIPGNDVTSSTPSSRGTVISTTPIVAGQPRLENNAALRDFFAGLYAYRQAPTTTYVGIANYGDSIAPHTWLSILTYLGTFYPSAALSYPSAGNSALTRDTLTGATYDGEALTVNQAVMDGTGGFADFTYLPSGRHTTLGSGGVLRVQGGESIGWTRARTYLATGPGMGSATVELRNRDSDAVLQTSTVNLSGATLGATKVEFTGIDPTIKLRVRVAADTGPVVHLQTFLLRSSGLVPLDLGRGNTTFTQNNFAPSAILNHILTDFNTALIVVQAKEEGWAAGTIPTTLARLATHTTSSKLVMGSMPDGLGATQVYPTVPADRQVWRTSALAANMAYYDLFAAAWSYPELQRLGWITDTTHPDPVARDFGAAMLLSDIAAFLVPPGLPSRRGIDLRGTSETAVLGAALNLQDSNGTLAPVITRHGGSDPKSFNLQGLRYVKFRAYDAADTASTYGLGGYPGGLAVYTTNDTFANGLIRVSNVVSTTTTASTYAGPIIGASDLEVTDSTKGIVLKSPNGTRWRVTVSNAGTLSVGSP
jgi:hypothetical protein